MLKATTVCCDVTGCRSPAIGLFTWGPGLDPRRFENKPLCEVHCNGLINNIAARPGGWTLKATKRFGCSRPAASITGV